MWSIRSGLSTQKIRLHTWWSVQGNSLAGRVSDSCSAQVLAGKGAVSPSCPEGGSKRSRLLQVPSGLWTTSPVASLGLSVLLPLAVAWMPQERRPPTLPWVLLFEYWDNSGQKDTFKTPTPHPKPLFCFHCMFENLLKPWNIPWEDYVAVLIG